MRDETSWIDVRHLFPRELLKRRDKNANLSWSCACFVCYTKKFNHQSKIPAVPCKAWIENPCVSTRSVSSLQLCATNVCVSSGPCHRWHSRGQGKRPAFPLQKPDPYFQLWVLYTRYHAQGRQCHCFFRILFIFAQAFHCPHRRLCRYRRHLLYPMHGLHRNPWS